MTRLDLARKDTIAALATPPGRSALAVVRVSGPQAEDVRLQVFRPHRGMQRPFQQTLGFFVDARTEHRIDEGLCTAFPKGRSYTSETAFEASVHGNPEIVDRLLASLRAAGCRTAEPGEFTLRAFLSGRLDLSSAEAVHDLIDARGRRAASQALAHLQGELRNQVETLRTTLVDVLAELEARLDFPEDPIGEADQARLLANLGRVLTSMKRFVASASFGQRQREGVRVVLLGRPNVGKSTLLNALYGEERALVYDRPGTTRDALEVELDLDGFRAVLVDVAGVRQGENLDPVELLGIGRVEQELRRASAVLFLSDRPNQFDETSVRAMIPQHLSVIDVQTKVDLAAAQTWPIAVSAKAGLGLEELREHLTQVLFQDQTEEIVLSKERHRSAMEEGLRAVEEGRAALEAGLEPEVVCAELRRGGEELDRILGADLNEDVLDAIFSRFCIGK